MRREDFKVEDNILWFRPCSTENAYTWLECLVLDEEGEYVDVSDFIVNGIIIHNNKLPEVIEILNAAAEKEKVSVMVNCAPAHLDVCGNYELGISEMAVCMRKERLAYLNFNGVPNEYRTEAWYEYLESDEV